MREWSFTSADLRRLGRYTYLARDSQAVSAVRLVLSAGERAQEARIRSERSAALRLVAPRASLCMPGIRHIGKCLVDGQPYHCMITDFVTGRDLTSILSNEPLVAGVSALEQVYITLGRALRELHGVSLSALDAVVPISEAKVPTLASWPPHVPYWIGRFTDYLTGVSRDVEVGGCTARQIHALLPGLSAKVGQLALQAGIAPFQPALLHNDVHGGNILAASQHSKWRLAGIIDERLRVGDCLFDVACLLNWAYEFYEPASLADVQRNFLAGYGTEPLSLPGTAARMQLYNIERSLGRLARYFPMPAAERESLKPKEVSGLHKHLKLLEHVSNGTEPESGQLLFAEG